MYKHPSARSIQFKCLPLNKSSFKHATALLGFCQLEMSQEYHPQEAKKTSVLTQSLLQSSVIFILQHLLFAFDRSLAPGGRPFVNTVYDVSLFHVHSWYFASSFDQFWSVLAAERVTAGIPRCIRRRPPKMKIGSIWPFPFTRL